MKKTMILLLVMLLTLGLVVAGCGQEAEQPAPAPAPADAPADAPDEAPAEAEVWPAKSDTVTLILPSSPGGGTDTKGRIVQQYLGQELGCHILVENITGGSHVVATEAVLNNYPHDMTVLLQQMEPYFTSGPIRGGDYAVDQFSAIGNIDTDPQGLFVLKSSEIETLEDLIEAMQTKSMSYSYLTGSFMAVGPEMLNGLVGGQPLIGIPYDGGSECATALLGGHVEFYCKGVCSTMAYYSEDFRLLGVFNDERYEDYPDVPTVNEILTQLGYETGKALNNLTYYICTKEAADAYPERYARVQEAINNLFNNPEFIAALEDMSYKPYYMDADELQQAIDASGGVVDEFSQYWTE